MRPQRIATMGMVLMGIHAAALGADAPQVLLENENARVLRVVDAPHVKSAPHDHKLNRVMLYLQAGTQEIRTADGKSSVAKWKAGEVKWSPATGTHTSEVTSNAPVTILEVELKKEGDPRKSVQTALDPLKVDPADYHLEFENSQVRVIRVKMGAHRSVPQHEHVLNRVVMYLTDQNTKLTSSDGKVETAQHRAGEVSAGGPVTHKEENLLDRAFEAIVVEFKN